MSASAVTLFPDIIDVLFLFTSGLIRVLYHQIELYINDNKQAVNEGFPCYGYKKH